MIEEEGLHMTIEEETEEEAQDPPTIIGEEAIDTKGSHLTIAAEEETPDPDQDKGKKKDNKKNKKKK